MMFSSCSLSSFVKFRSAVAEKKSKMSQTIRGWGSHFGFHTGLQNTNFVEDIEILLPVKFHQIHFGGSRGEVENVSVNHRPGQQSWFSDWPEQYKLGRGH